MTKMTKKDMFNYIRDIFVALNFTPDEGMPTAGDCLAFIDHELELLTNKTSGKRKPTKNQIENENYKADILTALHNSDHPVNISELMTICPSISQLTNQRISRLLVALRQDGKVKRTYEKKVAYFSAI